MAVNLKLKGLHRLMKAGALVSSLAPLLGDTCLSQLGIFASSEIAMGMISSLNFFGQGFRAEAFMMIPG